MRFSTIHSYIFSELVSPFFNCLFFLTFVFLMTRIPEIINMAVNYDVSISSVLAMIVFTLPRLLEFTIPMSVTISILLTFMRLSSDNEILALKSAGISLYKILPPVWVFCFLGTVLTAVMTVYLLPMGNLSLRQKSLEFARSSGVDMLLKERQFNSKIPGITAYASHVDIRTHTLEDIIFEDRRDKGVVNISTAPSGRVIRSDRERIYVIRLYNGLISAVNVKDKTVSNTKFEQYDIQIDLAKLIPSGKSAGKRIDERNLAELIRLIVSPKKSKTELNTALMEMNEKFSLPFACFTLGILSVSLGIQLSFMQRSTGYGVGIFFFLLYYLLLAAGWSLGESGTYLPFLGMWMPNIILGGVGIYLLTESAKEKSMQLPDALFQLASTLGQGYLKKI